MAHSGSKHTLTIYLSNYHPKTEDVIFEHSYALQGNTTVVYNLSGIQENIDSTGIRNLIFDYRAAGGSTILYNPKFSGKSTSLLPFTASNHTFYQSTSSPSLLSAVITVVYNRLYDDGIAPRVGKIKPLSAKHIIEFYSSAENVVDKNLKVLNSQMFTAGKDSRGDFVGEVIPILNFETDENIIYPMTFVQGLTTETIDTSVYLATDPESLVIGQDYIARSIINPTPALSSNGGRALSGNGFTVQGRSGVTYTGYFTITGDTPTLFHRHGGSGDFLTPISELSSTNKNVYISVPIEYQFKAINSADPFANYKNRNNYNSVLTSISASFSHLLKDFGGTEFQRIETRKMENTILFHHTNLLPPDATIRSYVISTSGSVMKPLLSLYPSWQFGKMPRDIIYNYPTAGYGLSAVNRITTDPDQYNIVVL